ncbi:amino acid ABC transporter permease [Rhodococcus sp. HM1]|uniref:amino acid ABC transporter permease n=1 Tax=Rhodococcus sp. HM1 TaxID=2937759 RepID=UPI0024A62B1F|nr:amino acid ABC transporter permease [Rhodococcus sp. HM1]
MGGGLLHDWAQQIGPLAQGLWVSARLAVVGLAVGLPLGLLLAIGVGSKGRSLRWACVGIVEIARGTPMLVVLQLVYFGLPQVNITFSSFVAAVVSIAVITAAYTSEIFRSGLAAVPHGQQDAARALGLRTADRLRYVIVPQGIRIAIPPLLNFAILIFQGTSLAFTIAVPELMAQAYGIGASTFLYMQVLSLAGLMYAAITLPSAAGVRLLEKRLGRHVAAAA